MGSVDAFRAAAVHLPFWFILTPVLLPLVVAAFAAWIAAEAGVLVGGRASLADAWPERARRAWPSMRILETLALTVPLCSGWATWELASPVLPIPRAFLALLAAGFSLVAIGSVAWRLRRRTHGDDVAFSAWAHGYAAEFLVSASGLLVAVPVWFMASRDVRLLAWLAAGAVGVVSLLRGGVVTLLRGLDLATPAKPRLLAACALAGGFPPRVVVEVRSASARAWALPMAGAILVTDGMLARLDDEQLASVLRRTIARLREPALVQGLRLASWLLVLFVPPFLPIAWDVNPMAPSAIILGLAAALVAISAFVRRAVRRAEAPPDGVSRAYARSLECIQRWNLAPVVHARSQHEVYDVLAAAGCDLPTPRPLPISRLRVILGLGIALVVGGAAFGAGHVGTYLSGTLFDDLGGEAAWTLSTRLGSEETLLKVGQSALETGDPPAAIRFFAAMVGAEEDPRFRAWLAIALARGGRCDEARRARDVLRNAHAVLGSSLQRTFDDAQEVCP